MHSTECPSSFVCVAKCVAVACRRRGRTPVETAGSVNLQQWRRAATDSGYQGYRNLLQQPLRLVSVTTTTRGLRHATTSPTDERAQIDCVIIGVSRAIHSVSVESRQKLSNFHAVH